ncbi:hypothetical protein U9M48_038848 [Paspalum notatum var. saurae]|uniref:Protein kinase domain-containing protein n=1 Tax=Paspalum notatum var. saurae TaxID=547442 RepID=A0AAQ3UME9_PASNO
MTRKIKLHNVKRKKKRDFQIKLWAATSTIGSTKFRYWWKDDHCIQGARIIITFRELEKATNNFHPSHEIGGGGTLNLHLVAIKKSNIILQREIDDFINEVAILSQINHRNIFKLLGFYLEVEVPRLVYGFISNDTLSHHLHVESTISLSWDDRLRIALEIAKALAYLLSFVATPILHRDIK